MKKYALSEIFEIIGGGTPKTTNSEYWNGDIPWLSVKDFNSDEKWVDSAEKSITEKGLKESSTSILHPGDLIVSARGTVGALAMVSRDMAFNQSCYGLRAKKGFDIDYTYYLLKGTINKLKANTHGSVFDTITRDTFDQIFISVPEYEVQKKIGVFLSNLDEKIRVNTRINKNFDAQAIALIDEYCKSTQNKVPFCSVMSFTNGYPFKSESYQKNGIYRVITIKNVLDGKIDSTGASHLNEIPVNMKETCKLRIGDVLLSLTGNVGRVGVVTEQNLLLNQRVAKIEADKKFVPLLYFYFRRPETKASLEAIARGTAQKNLSPVETLDLSFPYNKEAILELSKVLSPMFDSIIQNDKEITFLSSIRDTLLPKLLSGELKIS